MDEEPIFCCPPPPSISIGTEAVDNETSFLSCHSCTAADKCVMRNIREKGAAESQHIHSASVCFQRSKPRIEAGGPIELHLWEHPSLTAYTDVNALLKWHSFKQVAYFVAGFKNCTTIILALTLKLFFTQFSLCINSLCFEMKQAIVLSCSGLFQKLVWLLSFFFFKTMSFLRLGFF